MNNSKFLIFLVLAFSLFSCSEETTEKEVNEPTEFVSSDLALDHLNIWVKNPQKTKQLLTDIGFTSVPDSLSQVHHGQGTAGRYFRFFNAYLELIFVNDKEELEQNNAANKELDFTERANFEQNGACPLSIALKVNDYDIEKIPFEKVRYHQDWMEEGVSIYSAKNSKTHLNEPSIFVIYPEIEADQFETVADLQNIPEEHAIWREFHKHPNGAQKISKVEITSVDLDSKTETMKAVNGIENITVKNGSEYLMEIYFDNHLQGKSFDLRPDLPLIVYL